MENFIFCAVAISKSHSKTLRKRRQATYSTRDRDNIDQLREHVTRKGEA